MNQLCENCGHPRADHYWEATPNIYCRHVGAGLNDEACGCMRLKIGGIEAGNTPPSEDKQYTPIRRFYSWVGFISIFIWIALILAAVIWANHYIDANIPIHA